MSKRQSPSQTSVPAGLQAQIDSARKMVEEHERRGNKDTYWHSELTRRLAVAEAYAAINHAEVDAPQHEEE